MSQKKEEQKERRRSSSNSVVPPGFRFHPTDEELIDFYLRKKVATSKFELDHVIPEVDLNKLEPWDLREKCKVDSSHQTEWYFFSHKDKKYPTGTRTNRATKAGFWKATGRDKAVLSSLSQPHQLAAGQRIGMRKTLVFYKGRAPHGLKTDWIMHEYRLQDADPNHASKLTTEDGWVVCRVFKKKNYEEKSSTSASSYYDHTNLSDEEQAPTKATHKIVTTLPEVGSSQSIMSFSKPAQRLFKKQDMNSLAPSMKVGGTNNLALLSCKQEVMGDQYEGLSLNPNHQPLTTTFFQLPHLESTEIISPNYHYHSTMSDIVNNASILHTSNPSSVIENQMKRVEGSQKVHHLSQYMNNFEESTSTSNPPHAGKAFFMNEEDLAHCIDTNNNNTQQYWSLHDINQLARLQGTELALANLANDQLFPHFNGVHLSKVLPAPIDNYPSTYEIELWNFPR